MITNELPWDSRGCGPPCISLPWHTTAIIMLSKTTLYSSLTTYRERCEKIAPCAWVLDPVPASKVNWFMLANVQLWGAVVELVIIGFQFEPNRWWSSQSQTISSPQLRRERAQAVQDSSAEDIQYHICISLPHFPMFIYWLSSLGHR